VRPYPLTVLSGGINRQRVKGGASASQLYDLTNAYITNAGSIVPREGTNRTAALTNQTIGLAAANGTFNIFATNTQLVAPVMLALTASTSGGSGGLVSGTTYYYVIEALNVLGSSTGVSNELHILATGAAPSIFVTYSPVSGASAYNIYRGTTPGGENVGAGLNTHQAGNYQDAGFSSPGVPVVPNGTTIAVPPGYTLNILSDPNNRAEALEKIWFAKPFMGFEFVVAEFVNGDVVYFWLQNDGTWTSGANYTSASIVLPLVPNGLAYQAVQMFTSGVQWTPETVLASGAFILPTTPTGFVYEIINIAGSPAHTGQTEPDWPIIASGQTQEFGDFDQSSTDAGTTQSQGNLSTAASLSATITNKYGNSATISNSGIYASSVGTLSSLTLASTKVATWTAGTTYPPGAVVIPTIGTSTFTNAIPNGDFSGGSGLGGWTFADIGGAAAWNYTTGSAPLSIGIGYDVGGASLGIPGGTSMGANGASATMITSGAVTPGQTVTAKGYCCPNNSGADLTIWIQLNWYGPGDTPLGTTGNRVNEKEGYTVASLAVTGIAPSGATGVRVAIYAGAGTTSRNEGYVAGIYWNLEIPSLPTNFLYEAVQPTAGKSAATEPTWPTVLGNEVIDGQVTWQAIGTSIITYEAIPLMQAGVNVPVFPTQIGAIVIDSSTFTDSNGFVINTTMEWIAVDRSVVDTNSPNTPAVAIGASHIFAGNNDIADYSAAVNPLDWTSTNNAGYLPTGLNNYGDNPIMAIALYRGNLIVFNSGGYQMWQIDPDPQNMAFLDAQAVGCIWTRSCQSIANDLIFLTEIGVRNLGTIGATANMAIGNTGQPVDPLILAQIQANTYDPFTIYYPGRGQYMLIYGPQMFVLTINGLQGTKSWSRYIFPQAVTDATLNSGSLYLRTTGNLVWQLNANTLYDDTQILASVGGANISFMSTAQWPYMDMGGLGLNKMLVGVDLVGDGSCILQIGFDQQDDSTFSDNPFFATSTGVTAPYYVQVDDTVPGEPLPIPINAPSYSLILTFPSYDATAASLNTWTWEAANFYLAPQGGGGVTG
jgi:hypothetical protein